MQNTIKQQHEKIINENFELMVQIKAAEKIAKLKEGVTVQTFQAIGEVEKLIRYRLITVLNEYPLNVSSKIFDKFDKIV